MSYAEETVPKLGKLSTIIGVYHDQEINNIVS